MEPFSFKKLSFFNKRESLAKKTKDDSSGTHLMLKPLRPLQKLAAHPHLFVVIFALAIAYLISYVPSKSLPQLVPGEIASSDVAAPADLTLEDRETTEMWKEEAEAEVLPVYSFDENTFLNTEIKVREFFSAGLEMFSKEITSQSRSQFIQTCQDRFNLELDGQMLQNLIDVEFSATLEESLINLLGIVSGRGVILSKNLFIHDEDKYGFTLIRGEGKESTVSVDEILDKEEGKNLLSEEIDKLELEDKEKALLVRLSHSLLTENINFNPTETAVRREEARQSIETVFYTIKKGKVLIRRGDEVTSEIVKLIEEINANLRAKPSWLVSFLGTFILFILLFFALLYYLSTRYTADEALNRFIMTAFTLLFSLLLYKVSSFMGDLLSESSRLAFFSYQESYRYAFPLQMATLLFTYLSGIHLALVITILNGVLIGYLLKANFYLMVFAVLGGVAAIWGVRYLSKRSQTPVLMAGFLFVAPTNALILAVFMLLQGRIGPTEPFFSDLFMGILGGALSAALAFLFLPLYEQVFGIVTQNRLLALTNSDLPILRSMAMAAPGSYHHSLVVASLGEAAAEEIGLDPLLVKAGALYHDIGKIKRPEYFIENRTRNFDLHKDLKPSMSFLVIINHVKEGVEQANKLHLPRKIKDIIAQHHGTSLVRYFYEKAKVEYDPQMQNVGEESYRYAGPKPSSREAAVVMLADSVEAASRSLKKPTQSNLKRLITEIFNANIQDGQLDDSNFSIKELKAVANSFLTTLYTIYHPRVEYPGFDFEGQKARTNSNHKNNGRNSKPTKKA